MIAIQIKVTDSSQGKSGAHVSYQATPSNNKPTDPEVFTSNVIMAFCDLLSDEEFVDLIAPHIMKRLDTMIEEQRIAIEGSERVM